MLSVLLLLLLSSLPAAGQCPSGTPPPAAVYTWRSVPDAPDQIALYADGVHVGSWSYSERYYRPLTQGVWGPPQAAPLTLPARPDPASGFAHWQTHGVEADKVHAARERFSLGGRDVDRAEGLRALARSPLQDDSRYPWLIVSGTDAAKCEEFVKRLQTDPESATWLKQVRLWAGPGAAPRAPMMLDRQGQPFRLTGADFEAILEAPDGQVLWHETSDRGPETISALRSADPNYTPTGDPGPRANPLAQVPLPVWVLGGVALLLLLKKGN